MKKIISLIAAGVLALSAIPASYADVEPTIKVDGRMVDFRNDQAPVIMNDRLYVPLRRVIEEMGASVSWDGEKKMVTVNSDNNVVVLYLTIDSTEITKYTFTTVINATKETLISDVAPVIMNDRTMLPIRIIAESIGATVEWDAETKLTTITTRKAKRDAEVQHGADISSEDFEVSEFFKDKVPHLSLACDAEDISKGDTLEVKIMLSDIEKVGENKLLNMLIASIYYNDSNFKYLGSNFVIDGEKVEGEVSEKNATFMPGLLKLAAINSYEKSFKPGEDGVVAILSFEALNDEGGEFKLSTGSTELGPNNIVILYEEVEGAPVLVELENHDEIYIDTTAVTVK